MAELRVRQYQPDCYSAIWTGLVQKEKGEGADIPISSSTRTVQIIDETVEDVEKEVSSRTFPGAATVSIQGSMDGVHWETLRNTIGDKLDALTEPGIYDIAQCTRYVRPMIKFGDTNTLISVAVLAG